MTENQNTQTATQPKESLGTKLGVLLVLIVCIVPLVWNFMDTMADRADWTQGLPPCVTEDSDNCYWDGSSPVQGNGQGESFITVDGVTSYRN